MKADWVLRQSSLSFLTSIRRADEEVMLKEKGTPFPKLIEDEAEGQANEGVPSLHRH